jgi:UDP-N-acetylmuramate--alanine ligase
MLTKEEVKSLKLEDLKKVHLIGITSGFSSFVATHLLNLGVEVTASEINQDNHIAKEWIERGVLYEGGHDAKYITEDIDLVIFPNGPIPGNPECEMAEKLGISSIRLPEIFGLISKNFKTIAIAGTHGKTTTSALVTWMLYKEYGELPNFVIGDDILEINKAFNYNKHSEYLVVESCEYKRQFLDRVPTPYITVITNIELDHTDYYKDQEDYNSAFKEFVNNTTNSVVVDRKGLNVDDVLEGIDKNIIDCNEIEGMYEEVTARLHGIHNHENVLRTCGVAYSLGIFPDIEDFPGIVARFEYIGRFNNGPDIYLDSAHNPKKVKSCLQGTKEVYPNKKIIFVWQPHSIERSISFKEEFSHSLDDADVVLIPNIYTPIREMDKYRSQMSDKEFVEYLKERNSDKDIRYTENFEKTVEILKKFNDDSVLVFASAGDLKDIFKLMNIEK